MAPKDRTVGLVGYNVHGSGGDASHDGDDGDGEHQLLLQAEENTPTKIAEEYKENIF